MGEGERSGSTCYVWRECARVGHKWSTMMSVPLASVASAASERPSAAVIARRRERAEQLAALQMLDDTVGAAEEGEAVVTVANQPRKPSGRGRQRRTGCRARAALAKL